VAQLLQGSRIRRCPQRHRRAPQLRIVPAVSHHANERRVLPQHYCAAGVAHRRALPHGDGMKSEQCAHVPHGASRVSSHLALEPPAAAADALKRTAARMHRGILPESRRTLSLGCVSAYSMKGARKGANAVVYRTAGEEAGACASRVGEGVQREAQRTTSNWLDGGLA
jgi:hypothetical protein